MAFINFQPSDHFNTLLYTGDGQASRSVTGVGFQPDWVWFKNRNTADHHKLFDVVRGANKVIYSNLAAQEATVTQELQSFNSDGFTVGTESAMNGNGNGIAAWNWKAGNAQGSSNTDGTINTTYTSVNTTAGFSISKYVGTGSNGTIGHGLGAVPKWIVVKNEYPSSFWLSLSAKEKISFVNGAYSALSVLKNEHKKEVAKQYLHDKNWIEPYYIERYYSVIEEYYSEKVGYDIQIITMHMDAFYANSDNLNIPIMDALKVVSLIQDGMRERANLRLLQLQRKY